MLRDNITSQSENTMNKRKKVQDKWQKTPILNP